MSSESIQSVYGLSPTQEGILFHVLYSPDAGIYFVQAQWLLKTLDVSAFHLAWGRVIGRHTILRTSFHWEELDKAVQVVHQHVDVPFEVHDWRHLGSSEQKDQLRMFLKADRSRGFDLSTPCLMRLSLIGLSSEEHAFIWSFHHLLLDGWSLSLVIEEVFQEYESELAGEEVNEGEEGEGEEDRYERYIEWLEKQDIAEAEKYWRKRLEGFRSATALGIDRARAKETERDQRYE